jgi:hypothetical protein
MILVNLRIGHIVQGYDRICHLERTLLIQWRSRLLAAYSQRRKIHDQKTRLPKKILQIGITIAMLLIVAGGILWGLTNEYPGVSLALIGIGLVGMWVMLVYAAVIFTQPQSAPPQHPLRIRVFQPMLPRWREAIRGRFPMISSSDYGANAEKKFIEYIDDIDSSSFVLYRLKQRENEDADVIVIGQKGIWVFEVKYWSGKITYHNAKWERNERIFMSENGKREKIQRHMSQPPDELWKRECGDIAITLKRRAAATVARVPLLADIKGGIVFSHPNAKLDIDSSLQVKWNDATGWKRTLMDAPNISGMDERTCLEVLDALLSWYQELTNMSMLVSMDRVARDMGQQTKNDLERWVRQSK